MANLLHIDSSMRTEQSRSRALSRHFAEVWQSANAEGTVVYRDLAADPIPHLDHDAFSGNFTPAEARTPYQQEARALAERLVGELLEAEEIVIGMPLYSLIPRLAALSAVAGLRELYESDEAQSLAAPPDAAELLKLVDTVIRFAQAGTNGAWCRPSGRRTE